MKIRYKKKSNSNVYNLYDLIMRKQIYIFYLMKSIMNWSTIEKLALKNSLTRALFFKFVCFIVL